MQKYFGADRSVSNNKINNKAFLSDIIFVKVACQQLKPRK